MLPPFPPFPAAIVVVIVTAELPTTTAVPEARGDEPLAVTNPPTHVKAASFAPLLIVVVLREETTSCPPFNDNRPAVVAPA